MNRTLASSADPIVMLPSHLRLHCLLACRVERSLENHSGKSAAIRESNQGCMYGALRVVLHVCTKCSILLAGTDVWKISYVACEFSPITIDFSDYQKSLISRINAITCCCFFSTKYRYIFFF